MKIRKRETPHNTSRGYHWYLSGLAARLSLLVPTAKVCQATDSSTRLASRLLLETSHSLRALRLDSLL